MNMEQELKHMSFNKDLITYKEVKNRSKLHKFSVLTAKSKIYKIHENTINTHYLDQVHDLNINLWGRKRPKRGLKLYKNQ